MHSAADSAGCLIHGCGNADILQGQRRVQAGDAAANDGDPRRRAGKGPDWAGDGGGAHRSSADLDELTPAHAPIELGRESLYLRQQWRASHPFLPFGR